MSFVHGSSFFKLSIAERTVLNYRNRYPLSRKVKTYGNQEIFEINVQFYFFLTEFKNDQHGIRNECH